MSGIFISYRREDSAAHAGRLNDRLCDYFGADQVFMDVDDIEPGADFISLIEQKVASCDALIAVIGKGWLMRDEEGRRSRLDNPHDFVRLEIEHALRRNILVIPALVGGAEIPKADDLPLGLSEFAQRQAVELSDKDFQRDVDKVIAALQTVSALRNQAQRHESRQNDNQPSTKGRPLSWAASSAILIVMLFLAWQWSAGKKPDDGRIRRHHLGSTAALSGTWKANVTYNWGDSYREQFRFEPEDSRLLGTASFLGTDRGIEDGKIDGEDISFSVRFQEMSANTTTEHKNHYTGKMTAGNEIRFRMQDDRGNPPLEFAAAKQD
jgi:hypothetical protein